MREQCGRGVQEVKKRMNSIESVYKTKKSQRVRAATNVLNQFRTNVV